MGRDAGRDQRARARHRAPPRRAQDHQVEIDGKRGVRARPGDRSRGTDGRRDRPGRVHPADQRLRAALAHHRPGVAQEQGGGRRPVRQGARDAAQDRDRRAVPRGEGGAAATLSQCRHGDLRRQLLRRRVRLGRHRHQRGQRDPDYDAAARARRDLGHREDRPHAGRRGDADAAAPALGDRAVDLELRRRPDRGQGPRRVSRRRAHVLHRRRRWPLRRARRRAQGSAALHSLRRVHEPLSGLPEHRRALVRMGLSRSDRLDPDAVVHRH